MSAIAFSNPATRSLLISVRSFNTDIYFSVKLIVVVVFEIIQQLKIPVVLQIFKMSDHKHNILSFQTFYARDG